MRSGGEHAFRREDGSHFRNADRFWRNSGQDRSTPAIFCQIRADWTRTPTEVGRSRADVDQVGAHLTDMGQSWPRSEHISVEIGPTSSSFGASFADWQCLARIRAIGGVDQIGSTSTRLRHLVRRNVCLGQCKIAFHGLGTHALGVSPEEDPLDADGVWYAMALSPSGRATDRMAKTIVFRGTPPERLTSVRRRGRWEEYQIRIPS